ncbi:MAG: FAD-dependent oxidoreductase, partial [Leptospiraceae bacterium]|nr:FAD-dependent oxidoreductase [Leptospiraceae bacterium]
MKLRENNINKLDQQVFDVLIVGGGINGAVSVSSLASRGATVAMIDRGDFSNFTSQESSNLVWGGIKYMETMEFGLVRKLCTARNHLIKAYPANIEEIRFFVTLEKGFRFNRFFMFCGGLLYWLIGNFFTRAPRLLSRKRISAEEPVVNVNNATGGFEYSDAFLRDNDARFVFKFIRSALDHGAIVANYVESLGARREGDYWVTRARDVMDNRELTIKSKVIINACGPYVDEHNRLSGIETNHHHLFSKGIHLIVNAITPHKRVLTFFADDGRFFFSIPMGTKTCIGTTDTRVEQLPAVVTDEDRKFVLDNINKRLNLKQPLTTDDVIAERCGVRPLVVESNKNNKDQGDWTSLSRKHAIETDQTAKVISIFGCKLTGCVNVGNEV